MMKVKDQIKLLNAICRRNDPNYNIDKTIEELNELSLVLMQKKLKPNDVTDQQVIDEIGDVVIRISMLANTYDERRITKRIDEKLKSYKQYLKEDKYQNI